MSLNPFKRARLLDKQEIEELVEKTEQAEVKEKKVIKKKSSKN